MISLRGKRAIVTGGSRGIGAATALLLADCGADVGIGYRARAEEAAEVVRRIAAFRPEAQIGEVWRRYLEAMGLPDEKTAPLLDAERIDERLDQLPVGTARLFHACTHTTLSPNIAHGGSKINTIPRSVHT